MNNNVFFEGLPIYVINLKRSKQRYIDMMKSFKKLGIKKYFRIEAIDAKNIKDDSHIKYTESQETFLRLGMGHLGAFLSYLIAYQHFVNSEYEYAVISEDDIDFSNSQKINFNFYDTLKYHSPKYYNLKLHTSNLSISLDGFITDIRAAELSKPSHLSFGSCHIINKKWAELFLSKYNKHEHLVDENFKLTFSDKNNYFDDPFFYHRDNGKSPCAIDWATFDEHTFLWPIFSLMPEAISSTTYDDGGGWINHAEYFGEVVSQMTEIKIDTFIKNGILYEK